jgi:hypothetical protein
MCHTGPLRGKGLTVWPGIAVQYGHKQLVMPLTIPAERLAQPTLMAKAVFLIDPLGPRVEVIDTERLMQNPNYSQSGVSQGSLSRKLATRRVK